MTSLTFSQTPRFVKLQYRQIDSTGIHKSKNQTSDEEDSKFNSSL